MVGYGFAIAAALALWSAAYAAPPAPPAINPEGVINADSLTTAQLPGGALAPGSLIRIRGMRLGPAQPSTNGVSVELRQARWSGAAKVTFAGAERIDAVLPASTPLGKVSLTVDYHSLTSAPFAIEVVRSSFGILPAHATVAPGALVTIHGTGLGMERTPEVLVAGRPAKVRHAGPWRRHEGEDEIRFEAPKHAPQGCFVPVEVRSGGIGSNLESIAIALKGQPCRQTAPWLDRPQLMILLRAQMALAGPPITSDVGAAYFAESARGGLMLPPAGTCTAFIRTLTMEGISEMIRAHPSGYGDAGAIKIPARKEHAR